MQRKEIKKIYWEYPKELHDIFKPYYDPKTNDVRDDAPEEAKETLKKARKIAFDRR